ncbi:helix-turn-helix domain-containing protein [Arcanobacterium phocae]|uniref:helix-turn-helix domain-containing protein n=1 Tax=Arcanobacterium phocae TaxID=131112 RepID=UPI001C0EEE19|nr:helix-turn-helix domain-containing protein [Arcanobacterium phocae]
MSTTCVDNKITINEQLLQQIRQLPHNNDSYVSQNDPAADAFAGFPQEIAHLLQKILESLKNNGQVTVSTLPEILSSTSAAELLGISRPTLMKRATSHEIPSFKVGTHTRFRREDILAIRKQTLKTQAQALAQLHEFYDNEGSIFDD